MAGVNILLADGDEQYLLALVRKFIEGFENDGDIEMISDAAYLEEYFQTPRSLDIVVIQEEMYRDEFGRHNIGNLFLLTEDEPDGSFSGKLTEGQGLTAELLRKAGFKVFSEEQLDEVKDLLERHGDEGGAE